MGGLVYCKIGFLVVWVLLSFDFGVVIGVFINCCVLLFWVVIVKECSVLMNLFKFFLDFVFVGLMSIVLFIIKGKYIVIGW